MLVVERVGIEGERLTWDEICASYPDQWVCLRDATFAGEQVEAARVIGHGETRGKACVAGGTIDDCVHTGAVVEVRAFARLEVTDEIRDLVRTRR